MTAAMDEDTRRHDPGNNAPDNHHRYDVTSHLNHKLQTLVANAAKIFSETRSH
jgi:hypothetical protein